MKVHLAFKLPFESAVQRLKDVERCWKFHLFTALQDIGTICCNCPEISSYTSPCHPTTGSQSSSYRWAHGKVSWDDAKQCETICFNFWNKPISQSPIVILLPFLSLIKWSHILPIFFPLSRCQVMAWAMRTTSKVAFLVLSPVKRSIS